MGKYTAAVQDHLVLDARVLLPTGQVRESARPVAVRLVIDTGSARSTLAPAVLEQLNAIPRGTARVETSLASGRSNLFSMQLEFSGSLQAIPDLLVAGLALPPSLHAFHGVLGRDVLSRWEYLYYEGRRRRLTIRDTPSGLLQWLTRLGHVIGMGHRGRASHH